MHGAPEDMHEAMLWEPRGDGVVQCRVCPRHCVIEAGRAGVCRARVNREGVLYAPVYGRVCSVAADPIEKKPLYHFFPGSTVLSLGSMGCNFTCRHCQNWQIAHADPVASLNELRELPVRNLPVLADHNGCQGVAWTYNEPTIWLEYVLDGARVAHENDLYTVMVTNGYITEEALDVIAPHLDAYRVDVKAWSERAYYDLCRIRDFEPVLAAAIRAKRVHDCHVEIVTNVIPTINDDDAGLSGIAAWIAAELGRDTPWHVTRFTPYLELAHLSSTPIKTLERAAALGREAGLDFVYIGNVAEHPGQNTVCPNCHRLVVRRTGHGIEDVALRGTNCDMCGHNLNVRATIKRRPSGDAG